MAQKILAYTTADGDTLRLGEDSVVYVEAISGGGSYVHYSDEGAILKKKEVSDDLADSIAGGALGSSRIITVSVDGESTGIGANRILAILAEGSGSKVMYSAEGAAPRALVVEEAPAALEATIDAL